MMRLWELLKEILELDNPKSKQNSRRHSRVHSHRPKCAVCRKPRSRTYRNTSSIIAGEEFISGTCSRPVYADAGKNCFRQIRPARTIVVEFHHYVHTDVSSDGYRLSTATPAELSSEQRFSHTELPTQNSFIATSKGDFHNFIHEATIPPQVSRMMKPVFTPK